MARHIRRSTACPAGLPLASESALGPGNPPHSRPPKGGLAAWERPEGVGEAERAHPRRTGTAEVCPSDRQNFFANRLQLSIFAHTIILITVARSLPARLCSSCSVSATGLALESRATELELRKSKTPGLLSEGFVGGCSIDLRAAEMGEPSVTGNTVTARGSPVQPEWSTAIALGIE